jgi:hypothetical protein
MTTQDLIDYQLAAKAAGYVLTFKQGGCKGGAYCGAFIERGGEVVAWRPKECDGDAFRLAVRLHLNINVVESGVFASRYENEQVIAEKKNSDHQEAARLAVFKCAVEIGRAKQ